MEEFNIIEYLSGLTGFVFDKAVLKRIAYDRQVANVEVYEDLDDKTKELLLADLLLVAYLSPNTIASSTMQHGAYTKTVGAQTIQDKDAIYGVIVGIYKKYGDSKLDAIPNSSGTLEWME